MTRNDLNKIYYLDKELKMWQEELAKLEAEIGIKGFNTNGMPSSHSVQSATEREAIELMECKAHVEAMLININAAKNEVYQYIATIDDSLIRQIINYRCIKLMRWEQIAAKIGGGNSADGLKQMYSRFIRENISE